MEQIRVFIAIELPEEIRGGLRQIQEKLKVTIITGAKWVDPSGIHLTLKFLGNVEVKKLEGVNRAVEASARGIPPFPLEIKGLGVFPNLSRVQVIWVGIKGEVAYLNELQQRLESGLAQIGFPAEARRFTPHLTLARIRESISPEARQCLGKLINEAESASGAYSFTVGSVSVMRSQLTREGAIYTQLKSFKLK